MTKNYSQNLKSEFSLKNLSLSTILKDVSFWFLLLINVFTIIIAIKQNWNIINLMWVYWFQSVTIGVFNFFKLRLLEKKNTDNFLIHWFFALHYGLFHFVYLIFLLVFTIFSNDILSLQNEITFKDMIYILVLVAIFFLNHLFSYFYNKEDTLKQNIHKVMFSPYPRIVPMHLSIIFAMFLGRNLLIFFLILKTIMDVTMHIIEHKKNS